MEANIQYLTEINRRHTTHTFYSAIREVMWYVLTVIELLLLVRFFLQLFAVVPTGLFESLVYSSTEYLLVPFTKLSVTADTGVISWTAIIAIPTYLLLCIGIIRLISRSTSFSRIEAARALSKKKYGYGLKKYATYD